MGRASYDVLTHVVRRRTTRGGHVTRRDMTWSASDETLGVGPGPSGCRDGVGTGVERVITGAASFGPAASFHPPRLPVTIQHLQAL